VSGKRGDAGDDDSDRAGYESPPGNDGDGSRHAVVVLADEAADGE
jgi:hypothetical protein